MDRVKELNEAIKSSEKVLDICDEIYFKLKKVKNWSYADLFTNSIIVSIIKRNKLQDINSCIKRLDRAVRSLEKELDDVEFLMPNVFSNTGFDMAFDAIFDNIFTDLRVNSQIDSIMDEIEELADMVEEVRNKLIFRLENE